MNDSGLLIQRVSTAATSTGDVESKTIGSNKNIHGKYSDTLFLRSLVLPPASSTSKKSAQYDSIMQLSTAPNVKTNRHNSNNNSSISALDETDPMMMKVSVTSQLFGQNSSTLSNNIIIKNSGMDSCYDHEEDEFSRMSYMFESISTTNNSGSDHVSIGRIDDRGSKVSIISSSLNTDGEEVSISMGHQDASSSPSTSSNGSCCSLSSSSMGIERRFGKIEGNSVEGTSMNGYVNKEEERGRTRNTENKLKSRRRNRSGGCDSKKTAATEAATTISNDEDDENDEDDDYFESGENSNSFHRRTKQQQDVYHETSEISSHCSEPMRQFAAVNQRQRGMPQQGDLFSLSTRSMPTEYYNKGNLHFQLMELPEDKPPGEDEDNADDDDSDHDSSDSSNPASRGNKTSNRKKSGDFDGFGASWGNMRLEDFGEVYGAEKKPQRKRRTSLIDLHNDERFKFMFESTILEMDPSSKHTRGSTDKANNHSKNQNNRTKSNHELKSSMIGNAQVITTSFETTMANNATNLKDVPTNTTCNEKATSNSTTLTFTKVTGSELATTLRSSMNSSSTSTSMSEMMNMSSDSLISKSSSQSIALKPKTYPYARYWNNKTIVKTNTGSTITTNTDKTSLVSSMISKMKQNNTESNNYEPNNANHNLKLPASSFLSSSSIFSSIMEADDNNSSTESSTMIGRNSSLTANTGFGGITDHNSIISSATMSKMMSLPSALVVTPLSPSYLPDTAEKSSSPVFSSRVKSLEGQPAVDSNHKCDTAISSSFAVQSFITQVDDPAVKQETGSHDSYDSSNNSSIDSSNSYECSNDASSCDTSSESSETNHLVVVAIDKKKSPQQASGDDYMTNLTTTLSDPQKRLLQQKHVKSTKLPMPEQRNNASTHDRTVEIEQKLVIGHSNDFLSNSSIIVSSPSSLNKVQDPSLVAAPQYIGSNISPQTKGQSPSVLEVIDRVSSSYTAAGDDETEEGFDNVSPRNTCTDVLYKTNGLVVNINDALDGTAIMVDSATSPSLRSTSAISSSSSDSIWGPFQPEHIETEHRNELPLSSMLISLESSSPKPLKNVNEEGMYTSQNHTKTLMTDALRLTIPLESLGNKNRIRSYPKPAMASSPKGQSNRHKQDIDNCILNTEVEIGSSRRISSLSEFNYSVSQEPRTGDDPLTQFTSKIKLADTSSNSSIKVDTVSSRPPAAPLPPTSLKCNTPDFDIWNDSSFTGISESTPKRRGSSHGQYAKDNQPTTEQGPRLPHDLYRQNQPCNKKKSTNTIFDTHQSTPVSQDFKSGSNIVRETNHEQLHICTSRVVPSFLTNQVNESHNHKPSFLESPKSNHSQKYTCGVSGARENSGVESSTNATSSLIKSDHSLERNCQLKPPFLHKNELPLVHSLRKSDHYELVLLREDPPPTLDHVATTVAGLSAQNDETAFMFESSMYHLSDDISSCDSSSKSSLQLAPRTYPYARYWDSEAPSNDTPLTVNGSTNIIDASTGPIHNEGMLRQNNEIGSSRHHNHKQKPKRKTLPTKYRKGIMNLLTSLEEDPPLTHSLNNESSEEYENVAGLLFDSTTLISITSKDEASVASSKSSIQFIPRTYPFTKYWKSTDTNGDISRKITNLIKAETIDLPECSQVFDVDTANGQDTFMFESTSLHVDVGDETYSNSSNQSLRLSPRTYPFSRYWDNEGPGQSLALLHERSQSSSTKKNKQSLIPSKKISRTFSSDVLTSLPEDAPLTEVSNHNDAKASVFMYESTMLIVPENDEGTKYSDSSRQSLKLKTRAYPFAKYWDAKVDPSQDFERSMTLEQVVGPLQPTVTQHESDPKSSIPVTPVHGSNTPSVGQSDRREESVYSDSDVDSQIYIHIKRGGNSSVFDDVYSDVSFDDERSYWHQKTRITACNSTVCSSLSFDDGTVQNEADIGRTRSVSRYTSSLQSTSSDSASWVFDTDADTGQADSRSNAKPKQENEHQGLSIAGSTGRISASSSTHRIMSHAFRTIFGRKYMKKQHNKSRLLENHNSLSSTEEPTTSHHSTSSRDIYSTDPYVVVVRPMTIDEDITEEIDEEGTTMESINEHYEMFNSIDMQTEHALGKKKYDDYIPSAHRRNTKYVPPRPLFDHSIAPIVKPTTSTTTRTIFIHPQQLKGGTNFSDSNHSSTLSRQTPMSRMQGYETKKKMTRVHDATLFKHDNLSFGL